LYEHRQAMRQGGGRRDFYWMFILSDEWVKIWKINLPDEYKRNDN
jgi:hypothetical protein